MRFSYANITSTLALVLAIGTGGAVAADMIGGKAVKDGSLTGRDLRDGSVKAVDLAELPWTLPKVISRLGGVTVGDCAPDATNCPPSGRTPVSTSVFCQPGEVVLGGGIVMPGGGPGGQVVDSALTASYPDTTNPFRQGWAGSGWTEDGGLVSPTAVALCAQP